MPEVSRLEHLRRRDGDRRSNRACSVARSATFRGASDRLRRTSRSRSARRSGQRRRHEAAHRFLRAERGRSPRRTALARAAREAAALLAARGAQVVAFEPPHAERAHDLLYGILTADGGQAAPVKCSARINAIRAWPSFCFSPACPRPRWPRWSARCCWQARPVRRRSCAISVIATREHYWKLVEAQEAFRALFAHALDSAEGGPLDVLIGPAYALPALVHGATADLGTGGVFAVLYNVLGYPAGIVPFTRVREGEESERPDSSDRAERAAKTTETGSAGLPVGVQVIARPWRDHVALAAMACYRRGGASAARFSANSGNDRLTQAFCRSGVEFVEAKHYERDHDGQRHDRRSTVRVPSSALRRAEPRAEEIPSAETERDEARSVEA